MANKGMLTARYNRKLCFIKKHNDNNEHVDVNLFEPVVYNKPNLRMPSRWHDDLRKNHYVNEIGQRWYEIPKNNWRWVDIEKAQYIKLCRLVCDEFLRQNGYLNLDVVQFMKDNGFKILDKNILHEIVVNGYINVHRRKKVERNTTGDNKINHNRTHYGYTTSPIKPSGVEKQKWNKLMKLVSEDW